MRNETFSRARRSLRNTSLLKSLANNLKCRRQFLSHKNTPFNVHCSFIDTKKMLHGKVNRKRQLIQLGFDKSTVELLRRDGDNLIIAVVDSSSNTF